MREVHQWYYEMVDGKREYLGVSEAGYIIKVFVRGKVYPINYGDKMENVDPKNQMIKIDKQTAEMDMALRVLGGVVTGVKR